jgi:Phosphotransferase enzyme family
MSTMTEVLSTQLDPLRSPVLQQELPGVKAAFDAEIMRDYLQGVLFGKANSNYTIASCDPGQSVYPGDCCIIRYQLEVKDNTSGQTLEPLVIGRVFHDQLTAASYLRDKLAPLVERMRGREEIAAFATPAALIEPLNMVVYIFPIDGELPVLVDVTDHRRVREILGEMLRDVLDDGLTVQDCRVELGHYGRQHRCVLRYYITSTTPGDDTPQPMLIYGKIAADGRGALAGPVIAALHEQVLDRGVYQFNIPRSFGFRPDLQLALFESIPGAPQVAQLLKARLKGAETARPGQMTLEESLDACAQIAAALHSSAIMLGQRRALEDEIAGLRQGFAIVRHISPDLGAQFEAWLNRAESYAASCQPLSLCFGHGDFSYTQLIFEGAQSGLVDFDTICQAEPALDLGQFLAYVRVAVLKGKKADSTALAAMAEQLCTRFLQTYIAAMGDQLEDADRLRLRVPVYEIISLLRLGLHSWQKLKGSRLEYVIAILEERVSCLP